MGKEVFQKIKLLKIWEILKQDSEEQNPIDTIELIGKLANLGIIVDRKTLYKDIDELNKFGYEVTKIKNKRNSYYLKDRAFSMPELRILIDAVQSANFITKKKTELLIDKIANLGNSRRCDLLKNGVYFDVQKYNNEDIYDNISMLDDCINRNKKASFKYFGYDTSGKRVYRKEGTRYIVNPIALVFNDGAYYLVCYSDKHSQSLANYRVDRMDTVKMENEDILISDCAKSFDLCEHRRQAFCMFAGNESAITLQFDNSLVDVMLDKFGVSAPIEKIDNDTCKLITKVKISPLFFGWLSSFSTKIKLISPVELVSEYRDYISNVASQYLQDMD